MIALGPLAFTAPWVLAALALLPALWWLLRLTPPPARRQTFPPLRLLLDLPPVDDSAARTPPWLLALRLALALALIMGLARPLWHPPPRLPGAGPVLLVVDDGWAAGRDWAARQRVLEQTLDQAERESRPVALLTTAPHSDAPDEGRSDDGPLKGPWPVARMREVVRALRPLPWPTDRAQALAALERDESRRALAGAGILWLADGVDDATTAPDGGPAAAALARRLRTLGPVRRLEDGAQRPALALQAPETTADGLRVTLTRPDDGPPLPLTVQALAADGRELAGAPLLLAQGATSASLDLPLPLELRNDLATVRLAGANQGAAAVELLDGRWRRRTVGLIDDDAAGRVGDGLGDGLGGGGLGSDAQPLLSPFHYLGEALAPFSEIRRAPLKSLLQSNAAMLVLIDRERLDHGDIQALRSWMDKGGLLVRFAGPRLAETNPTDGPSGIGPAGSGLSGSALGQTAAPAADPLLPTALRPGDRSLGGALSWSQPAHLAPFDAAGPFAGLMPPADVTVSRQVLAQPSPDLDEKVWARLEDGTPLVTAQRQGRGWLVLVHTTPDPRWSNLALSGLFVDMLRRLVDLSDGAPAQQGRGPLSPLELLDGEGRLTPPPATALPLTANAMTGTGTGTGKDGAALVDPRHPPGYYGARDARVALNLAPQLPPLRPLDAVAGPATGAYAGDGTTPLAPMALGLAFALWLADLWISLAMRGLVRTPRAKAGGVAAAVLALALLAAPDGHAAPPSISLATPVAMPAAIPAATGADIAAATRNWLAYVVTGDAGVDATSKAGLTGLAAQLNRRTAVDVAGVRGLDVERDDLSFYPLIYWAVAPGEAAPSDAAVGRINRYLHAGGLILFDTRDPDGLGNGQGGGQAALRTVTRGLDIPRLSMVDSTHVLARSFFLLQDFPGRQGAGPVWVEAGEDQGNDGVSSVIVGSGDWAAAWAVDGQGRPLNAVTPGGERQRELAYRFGINVVMYALTGNYKADQVHVPAILERLGQ